MHVHVHTVPHARVAPSHHLRINAVESKKKLRDVNKNSLALELVHIKHSAHGL